MFVNDISLALYYLYQFSTRFFACNSVIKRFKIFKLSKMATFIVFSPLVARFRELNQEGIFVVKLLFLFNVQYLYMRPINN